ncbi:hypothetical protein AB0I27_22880 [Streptomyces sp. NPDC050597]|uniref:hypothetical protein n=1 Tax=Streptomyces sp. NPDC050597 TaxID=3157212 RepID=UPI0034410949
MNSTPEPQTTAPESARSLLWRHGLPEDVIDGALCLFAQELAGKIRARFDGSIIDDVREQDADLISPENWARTAAAAPTPVPPTVERRDRYAQALADADGWEWAEGFKEQSPTWLRFQQRADAVLAVADAEQTALRTRVACLTTALGEAVQHVGGSGEVSLQTFERWRAELAGLPACPDPIECSHEAALGEAQQEVRRLGLMVDEYGQGASALTDKLRRARDLSRRLAAHAAGFRDVLDDSDSGPWARTVGADIAALRELLDAPASVPQPETQAGRDLPPVCEGFVWIGQSFATCDRCGQPAWDHAGEEIAVEGADPFDTRRTVRPWKPGQADAIRAKWGTPTTAPAVVSQPDEEARWCKCPSCWGWFVQEHPGEDLDELGRDLSWWSGLPEHRDAPAGVTPSEDSS